MAISEQSTVERIARSVTVREGTLLGIGDDAAVLARSGPTVLTHDLLVEGVHFDAGADAADLGWKALAVNLSDVVAMGARPVAALVGLCLPSPPRLDLAAFYAGMEELAADTGVSIAGGDLSTGPALIIAVTATGALDDALPPLTRSGARAGDLLVVSGPLGASEAGRLSGGASLGLPTVVARRLSHAHRRPAPQIAASRALRALGAHAVMDCSDGVGVDAARMARASGCAVEIEIADLPRAEGVDAVARAAGTPADSFTFGAGEDYRLLAALAPDARSALTQRLPEARVIGRFTEGAGLTATRHGVPTDPPRGGYLHEL